jgi:60 kDa SS-A/Ro ribonucleoprotein
MSSLNKPNVATVTFEGAIASPRAAFEQLERLVLSCLLWEDSFYIEGEKIADLITKTVKRCNGNDVAALALLAKRHYKLRHVPLFLIVTLLHKNTKDPLLMSNIYFALTEIITRADDITEFLAMYWKDGKKPIPSQVKKALAKAFNKFDAYQLAKYNRDKAIKLRDAMFLVHPKPENQEQAELFKKLANNELESPETWEVMLSSGQGKKEVFTKLLIENKLGDLAFIRNLRNMVESYVEPGLIQHRFSALNAKKTKILPFQFVAAARAAPFYEPLLDTAMQSSLKEMEKLPGETIVLVDVSGSMDQPLSQKSTINRIDAASALAVLIRGISESPRIFVFSSSMIEIAPRSGMALIDAIKSALPRGSTYLGAALDILNRHFKYDRLIVITDEQSNDNPTVSPTGRQYIINVSPSQNGVKVDASTVHINGFSENIINYIDKYEESIGASYTPTDFN